MRLAKSPCAHAVVRDQGSARRSQHPARFSHTLAVAAIESDPELAIGTVQGGLDQVELLITEGQGLFTEDVLARIQSLGNELGMRVVSTQNEPRSQRIRAPRGGHV